MDLKQLRLFLAVCEAGSLNEAAREVHLSQPALSRQIRLLEDSLGVTLFDRSAAGMVPTPAGMRLRVQAGGLLDAARRIRAEVLSDDDDPAGEVALGFPTSLRSVLIRPVLARVAKRYPRIRIRALEGTSRAMRDALTAGRSDLTIAATVEDVELLRIKPLVRESLYLIGPPTGEAVQAEVVRPGRLARLPLALTPRPNSLRAVVDREAPGQREAYEPRYEVESFEMALDLIEEVGVYSVFPGSGIREAWRAGRIQAARLRGLHLTWASLTSRERALTGAAKRVGEVLDETVSDLLQQRTWPGARPVS